MEHLGYFHSKAMRTFESWADQPSTKYLLYRPFSLQRSHSPQYAKKFSLFDICITGNDHDYSAITLYSMTWYTMTSV